KQTNLYVQDSHGIREVKPLPDSRFNWVGLGFDDRQISMSPDGRYVVAIESVPIHDVPAAWHGYRDFLVQLSLSMMGKFSKTYSPFVRYVLIDVRSGESRVLL